MAAPHRTHRGAVLHHGVVQLVALGRPPREEAALTHIIIEVLEAAVPVQMGHKVRFPALRMKMATLPTEKSKQILNLYTVPL